MDRITPYVRTKEFVNHAVILVRIGIHPCGNASSFTFGKLELFIFPLLTRCQRFRQMFSEKQSIATGSRNNSHVHCD